MGRSTCRDRRDPISISQQRKSIELRDRETLEPSAVSLAAGKFEFFRKQREEFERGGGEKTETMIPCNGFSGNEYGSNNAASVEYQVNDALAYRISMLDCFILIHFRYPANLLPRDSSSTWSIKRITLRERF